MKTLGWPLVFIFTTIPVLLWVGAMPLSFRFSGIQATTTSLGQIAGLVGMTLMSLSLILSTRLSIFDPLFGGLNRAYIVHHQIGGVAFLLLLLHPLLLAFVYWTISAVAAAQFLFPGDNWAINFGIASLLLCMALIIFTYYVDLPYELWRFTHKFMGIAFLFGCIHSLYISSDISMIPNLRLYMGVMMSLGVLGYIYKTILGRFLAPHYLYTITSVVKKGDRVVEVTLSPIGKKKLSYFPGQFVFITLLGANFFREEHPFSVSSGPQDLDGFQLTAKAIGDFTNALAEVTVGTRVRVEGPFGRFSPHYFPSKKYLWIAGGIGITPFVSMARSLQKEAPAIDLYYLVRNKDEAVFLNELGDVVANVSSFRLIDWYSGEYGHLTGEKMLEITPDIKDREIFVCGPPAMMMHLKKELRNMGVAKGRIHSEEFSMS